MLLKKYEVYTISEFMNRDAVDVSNLDKAISHLKRNKKRYMMVVAAIAIAIDLSGITLSTTLVAATDLNSLQTSLGDKFNMIVELLKFVIKYACLGMGLKEMVIAVLNGGNMKEATMAGIQYWLGYLFMEFYPTLFDM